MNAPLLIEDHEAVRVLTLNRPEKKNAFDVPMTNALWAALEDASRDDRIGAVVVTAAGDLFSAGADINLFLAASQPAGPSGPEVARVARLYEPLRACAKPVIAAVQGPAVGMGVTLLPHFDLVYAAEEATFMVPFVKLGLVVEYGGSFTLPRLIGHQRARELLLRPSPIDASTAERWGLVTRVFPRSRLLAETLTIAHDIARQPRGAVAESRRLVAAGIESTFDVATAAENSALSARYGSAENVDAVMAFFASRVKAG